MNYKVKSRLAFITLGFTFFCTFSSANTVNTIQTNNPPNVLLIMVDDLNDYQGFFGGHPQAKTPNIDKLAASGVQFVNAQSNIPVCQPSRNSLFTGVYPHESKDYSWENQHKQKVLKHNKTLVELFNENGYLTAGTGKLMHGGLTTVWQEWGNPHKHDYGPFPFDGKELTVTKNVPAPYRNIGPIDGSYGRLSDGEQSSGKSGAKGWVYGWDKKPFRFINEQDRDLLPDELHAQWAIKKLTEFANTPAQQPFFMGIGFVRPHTPLYAPDRFFELYPIESLTLAPWMKNDHDDTHFQQNFPSDGKGLKYYQQLLASYNGNREQAIKHFLQAYLACVSFMDEQVGKVMSALEANKSLNENTLVVFTSDHGWQMGEKNYLFKNSPWEESTRIPFIIRPPKTSTAHNNVANSKVVHPVSNIDIYPTLVDYAQLEGDNRKNEQGAMLGGFSLRAFLENPETTTWQGPNGALSVVGVYGPTMNQWAIEKQNYSYRTTNWRYIHYSNGKEELYDHQNDPYEWHNLADDTTKTSLINKMKDEISAIIGTAL